jgi:hypothetical protein
MMIVSVKGVSGGADLSASLERDQFEIEATFGSRMDVLKCTLFDPTATLAIPDRAEIVIYDAPAGGAVTDPPTAISAYNTFKNGAGLEVTSTNPANWTPRLFAGYSAAPVYTLDGGQRYIRLQAQDYTTRLRSTVVNRAYVAGQSDQAIVQDIFKTYRPDFDTANVQSTVTSMPAISFPVHTLEQFMQRVTKVSRAVYRVDYYKRLFYGAIGQTTSPFNLSDNPNDTTTFGYEEAQYSPDVTGLSDKVWVVGHSFLSASQTYQIPAALVNGTAFQFPLPGQATKTDITQIQVAAANQTFGQAPGDGDITTQSTFKFQALIQPNPAIVAFATTPPNGSVVTVQGKFRYPLIQSYSDPNLVSQAGGLIFEAVIRDKRIRDLALAQNIAKAYLASQGLAMKGFQCVTMKRSVGSSLIQPGQTISVTGAILFAGLGGPTLTFLVTRVRFTLDDNSDLDHPYHVELEMVDRPLIAGGY